MPSWAGLEETVQSSPPQLWLEIVSVVLSLDVNTSYHRNNSQKVAIFLPGGMAMIRLLSDLDGVVRSILRAMYYYLCVVDR